MGICYAGYRLALISFTLFWVIVTSTLLLLLLGLIIYFRCLRHKHYCYDKLVVVVAVVCSCFAQCSGFGALVYVERSMVHNYRTMSRGWSNVGCWTGYGLSSVLLLVASCVSCVEMKKSGEHNIVHVQPYLPHCDTTHEETLFAPHKHSKQVRFQKKNPTNV